MKVAYMSTYIPQKCGLATYTHHLRLSVKQARLWEAADPVIVLSSEGTSETSADQERWFLPKHEKEAYVKMAQRVNKSDISVVSLQHEFGIFGGEAGSYVLDFVKELKKPLITTFHTVFENPEEPYRSIQQQIAERSEKIIVMNRKAIQFLHQAYAIPEAKIIYLPHGTPAPAKDKRDAYRHKLGWTGRNVLMTFGLLSRGKGLELVLEVLGQVADEIPNVLYAIVGQTHPEVKRQEGEAYRQELADLIHKRGLSSHVTMVDQYVDEEDLIGYLMACDLYVTPYPGMQQITSGTLAYAVGLGRPVVSTPYSYAKDLLAGCEQLLVPYGDVTAWAKTIISLLRDEAARGKWEKKIGQIGSAMHWPHVGKRHAQLFARTAKRQYDLPEATGGIAVASVAR